MRRQGLPRSRDLVHAAAIEIGTDRAFEFINEGVHFFVRRGPTEVTILVRNVASSDMIAV